jgi:hypothetical protein
MTGPMEVLVEQALQQRHIDGMLEWWRGLPDDRAAVGARGAAVEHIVRRLDEERAQNWLREVASTPYRPDQQIGEFAARLAQNDPAYAIAWVASLQPSPNTGHYTGIGRVIRAWEQHDAAGLNQWLARLPPSSFRDQVLAAR